MRKAAFLLALHSDSCEQSRPSNRPNNFELRLPSPISLTGDWEVALIDVHLPSPGQPQFKIETALRVNVLTTTVPIYGNLHLIGTMLRQTLISSHGSEPTYTVDTTMQFSDFFKHHLVEVPIGNYNSRQEIGDTLAAAITSKLSADYDKDAPYLFLYVYDDETQVGLYTTLTGLTVILVLDNPKLATLLGLEYRHVNARVYTDVAALNYTLHVVYFLIGVASTEAVLAMMETERCSVDTLYIFSDIVKPQLVGEIEASLLGVVPMKQKQNQAELRSFRFKTPMYLPISSLQFASVGVKLCTSRGKPFPFTADASKVVCTLHVRRCNSYI
jgi:hypothetical protein